MWPTSFVSVSCLALIIIFLHDLAMLLLNSVFSPIQHAQVMSALALKVHSLLKVSYELEPPKMVS